MDYLYQEGYQSVLIEGGRTTLQHFIDMDLWDEARIFSTRVLLEKEFLLHNIEQLKLNPLPEGLTKLLPLQKSL